MSIKLTYFNARARGELSRLLLNYSGVKFEDERIDFPDWPALKPNTPVGSLPVFEIEGKKLIQSLTIARYIASKHGLAGKTETERAIADGIVSTTEDLRVDFSPVAFETDEAAKKKKLKEAFEKAKVKMKFFENKLVENGGDYIVGKSLTWADLAVYDILFTTVSFIPSALDDFPKLKAHSEFIGNIPKIKAYVDSRPQVPF